MENQDSSIVQKGAEAAGAVRSAAKAGKAIAAAAKGAAVGGPFGAAVTGLLTNPGGIKIILIVLGLLMLPILFILMLPSVIFGGVTYSPTSTELPMLNDNSAIVQNINDISFSINSILGQGLDDVQDRISRHFAASSADELEIINPYERDPTCNINILVGQYCAARSSNYEQISIPDMIATLEPTIPHLYTYSRKLESRQETVTETVVDPLTGMEKEVTRTITIVRAIYTIQFNGEEYVCDRVFALDDEQKSLARDYSRNLSLFVGDGMFQGLLPDEFVLGPSYEGVTLTHGGREVVYFNQLDERFANEPYGTDNIGAYGCGPTSMSIVISTLTSETVDPINMSAWAYENGYWCRKSGSYHSLIPGAAAHWGLPCEGATPADAQRIADALADGHLVVALMSKGHFTSSGHYIVLRGIDANGKILVADPASYKRSQKAWDFAIILNEASRKAEAGGPFWIIG